MEENNRWGGRTEDEQQLWLNVIAQMWCQQPHLERPDRKMAVAISEAHEAVAAYRRAMT